MECLEGLHALGTELVQLYDAEVAPAVATAAASAAADAAGGAVASMALGGGGGGAGDGGAGDGGAGDGGAGDGGVGGGGGGGGEAVIAAPAVELIRCDFLVDDSWKEADVVLVNSCCFSEVGL
jgi:hypothetical protein